jgi:hypothetical protein
MGQRRPAANRLLQPMRIDMSEVLDRTRDAETKKGATSAPNHAGDILSQINDQEIEWVDLRFTDPKGKWQHLTMASNVIDEDSLVDGLMFDGSSMSSIL